MSIKSNDIKKLYGLSAGRCNICHIELVERDVHIGEMAHIIAKNSNGPRGNNQPIDNTYDSLILLCPTHHTYVDKNPLCYQAEKLRKIKYEYENLISLRLDVTKDYQTDLLSLNTLFRFIPITFFRAIVLELPNRISTNFNASYMFDAFCIDNPHRFPFNNIELTSRWKNFLEKNECIDKWIGGSMRIGTTELITENQMFNGYCKPCYNIYVPSDDGYLVLNKKNLTSMQIDFVCKHIQKFVQEFLYAHTELINYIRTNYKEIEW